MVAFSQMRERLRHIFSRTKQITEQERLIYPFSDGLQPDIFSSYCPIIPCAVLHSLSHREKDALNWLTSRFVDQFGMGKRVDLLPRSDPRLLVCLQQMFTGELRLFEAYFDVKFAWSGFERTGTDGSFFPFTYTRQALAHYYRRESLFYVGSHDCGNCHGRRSEKCATVMESKVKACFSRVDSSIFSNPAFDSFNHVQMAAWSLATSISTVMVLGAAMGCNSVYIWGSNLLNSWEPKLRQVMLSGEDLAGSFNSVCPQYSVRK